MKIGIKTFADEIGYELVSKAGGYADFVEIMPVPDKEYKQFGNFNLEFRVHAPHQDFGMDPADRSLWTRTEQCIRLAKEAADFFHSPTIIVHPGIYHGTESIANAINCLTRFNDSRFLIENLPAEVPNEGKYICSTAKEARQFIEALGCGLCLDFEHASQTGYTTNLSYMQIIKEFLKLNPFYFHINGGYTKEFIMHKSLFEGDFDIPFFIGCIPQDSIVVLETPQNAEVMQKEIKFLKSIFGKIGSN